jgi:hypothetical protein
MRDWRPLKKSGSAGGQWFAEPWMPAVIQISTAGGDIIVSAAVVEFID